MTAKQFEPMLQQPPYDSKWWRRKAGGGVSPCIAGSPKYCRDGQSALANCVGWSWGRAAMLEDDPDIRIGCWPGNDYPGNAQNWIEASSRQGFRISDKPALGAVACWISRSGKSGHVANVERINTNNITMSESAYGGYYWRLHDYPLSAYKSGYVFQGFILLPTDWILPSDDIRINDEVIIKGKGNASSLGNGHDAWGIGWRRKVLNIWEGRPYPYQVGNASGTTGFYKAEALEVIK